MELYFAVKILDISINNFRNIAKLSLLPVDGVNIFYGDNAQGKTSILEAIFLLTGQPSFRTRKSSELIRFSEERAFVSARIFSHRREQLIEAEITKRVTYKLNDVFVNSYELSDILAAVIFSPSELRLVNGAPSDRRMLLDATIVKLMPRYHRVLLDYTRALRQRNMAIFDYRQRLAPIELISAATTVLLRPMLTVINARRRLAELLSEYAKKEYFELCGNGDEFLELLYKPSICAEGIEELQEKLNSNLAVDIEASATTVGPHRDDLEILLKGFSAKSFASQGQRRSIAIAIKLAECKILEKSLGSPPILLLDDVFSELDESRRRFFLKKISGNQIFITSCDGTGLDEAAFGGIFRIVEGGLG